MEQGHNEMGEQWDRVAMGQEIRVQDRGTMGWGCKEMGEQWDRVAMGQGHTGMPLNQMTHIQNRRQTNKQKPVISKEEKRPIWHSNWENTVSTEQIFSAETAVLFF